MAYKEDQDWLFLDTIIALANDIINAVNGTRQRPGIKETSDNPAVLYQALQAEAAALVLKHAAREYRSRLRELKAERPANGDAGLSRHKMG